MHFESYVKAIGNTKICYQSRVYFKSIGIEMIYTETELALEKMQINYNIDIEILQLWLLRHLKPFKHSKEGLQITVRLEDFK